MPDRLNGSLQRSEDRRCRILTVLPSRWHRDTVGALCRFNDSGCIVSDVSNVTDAVLEILTKPVDVLVVDVGLAGDLLGVLQHHLRRSAPKAQLALVRADKQFTEGAVGHREPSLSWVELEGALARMFGDA